MEKLDKVAFKIGVLTMGEERSPLEQDRLNFQPPLPQILSDISNIYLTEGGPTSAAGDVEMLQGHFPNTFGRPAVNFEQGASAASHHPLRIGVVLSGGQAAGGHNVITGLYDAMQKLHPDSQLFGFVGGPSGIVEKKYVQLTQELLANYRNMGGFDLIGSGRAKIETDQQLTACMEIVQFLNLDGLVNIGGDDSNTNTAVLAEHFLSNGCQTKVIGVPKTIDGDLKNHKIEISFGFDTAAKTYSEMIGNIARDAFSAKKYYHFIRLMGRSASHIALECALQTHPNITLIGEEVAAKKMTFEQISNEIADVIATRSAAGKDYGIVLIPEGLIGFVPEMKQLMKELNFLLAKEATESVANQLSRAAKTTFYFLPEAIQKQLLLDRDPHGNVQVSHIETERLLIHAVKEKLQQRVDYKGKFRALKHFFGYEGRSGFPSNFDATYAYALGNVAVVLVNSGMTGYMTSVTNLAQPVQEWEAGGIPITMLMKMEERKGRLTPVIQISLVDLEGEPFARFASQREKWAIEDHYRYPGPIQFSPESIADQLTLTLQLEGQAKVTKSV